MPGTSTKVNLDEARACHQQAGRILIDDLSSHDADLLQAYHRHVGELLDDYSNAIAEPTVSFRELLAANPDTITDDTEVIITAGELRACLDELGRLREQAEKDAMCVAWYLHIDSVPYEARLAELSNRFGKRAKAALEKFQPQNGDAPHSA